MRSLLLLHGALGAPDQFAPLATALAGRYDVHRLAFPGHAGSTSEHFGIDVFAAHLEAYIRDKALDRPLLFGYSMGGYVALRLAATRPDLLGGIATLATKLHWTPDGAAREATLLNPEKMEEKVPAFASALQQRHAPLDWKDVVRRTAAMMQELGNRPLLNDAAWTAISLPVLLLLGDRDNMVTLEETVAAYKAIAGSQLGVLPGTPHPIEKTDVSLLAMHLTRFFGEDKGSKV